MFTIWGSNEGLDRSLTALRIEERRFCCSCSFSVIDAFDDFLVSVARIFSERSIGAYDGWVDRMCACVVKRVANDDDACHWSRKGH